MIGLCPTQRDTRQHFYYCSQRYYDPATMQWLSADPAKADGEESAYQYCGGDPVVSIDQSGLSYSPGAAKDYGRKYGATPNAAWHNYDGEDCTNFISQVMYAAGVKLRESADLDPNVGWWFRKNPNKGGKNADQGFCSHSWAVAHTLYSHMVPSGEFPVIASYTWKQVKGNHDHGHRMPSAREGDLVYYEQVGPYFGHWAVVVAADDGSSDHYTRTAQHGPNSSWHLWMGRGGSPNDNDKYYLIRPQY
jgi:RHS repeat-associated protein